MSEIDYSTWIECPNCDEPLHPGEPCGFDCQTEGEAEDNWCLCQGHGLLWHDDMPERQCPSCGWYSCISIDELDGAQATLTNCKHRVSEWEPCEQCDAEFEEAKR